MIKTKGNVRVEHNRLGRLLAAGLAAGVIGLGSAGCATQGTPLAAPPVGTTSQWDSQESYSLHHPVLVLYSDEMLALLADRDQRSEANGVDWITRRNDQAVGLRRVVWDPHIFSEVITTTDDSLRDSNGRPRSYSRRRVRTIRSGRGR